MSPVRWLRSLVTLAALGLGLLVWSEEADARMEDGWSFTGGPGSVVFDNSGGDDSFIQPYVGQTTYQGGSLGGLFNRPGLVGGFAAGFLGAGVVGLLFGRGMIGELSGMVSVLGLTFQLSLIVMLARLIWTWWRADNSAAFADLSPRQLADAYGRTRHEALPDVNSYAEGEFGEPASDAFNNSEGPQR